MFYSKERTLKNKKKSMYNVYIANEKKKENKAIQLLLEAVGAFVLGFCFVGFLYLVKFL